jgi:copper chaperone
MNMSNSTTYKVTGMTCGHCVSSVTAEVSKIGGVSDVQIDLASGNVVVTSSAPLDTNDVREAVDEAGYELASEGRAEKS